jgi:hypothetical protein
VAALADVSKLRPLLNDQRFAPADIATHMHWLNPALVEFKANAADR